MRRNIFYDKINIAYTETGKMSFQMTSFEEILNFFELRICWLNSDPNFVLSANYRILT